MAAISSTTSHIRCSRRHSTPSSASRAPGRSTAASPKRSSACTSRAPWRTRDTARSTTSRGQTPGHGRFGQPPPPRLEALAHALGEVCESRGRGPSPGRWRSPTRTRLSRRTAVSDLARVRQRLGDYPGALSLARALDAARKTATSRVASIERSTGLARYWSGAFGEALAHYDAATDAAHRWRPPAGSACSHRQGELPASDRKTENPAPRSSRVGDRDNTRRRGGLSRACIARSSSSISGAARPPRRVRAGARRFSSLRCPANASRGRRTGRWRCSAA